MAKNWRNSGFVAKFLTKFALSDKRKMAFLAAKSFGAYLSLCHYCFHTISIKKMPQTTGL